MKRAPRLLLVAFALSLLLHLVVALILHPPMPTPENQAEVVSIQHRPATIAVRTIPSPPPPPKHTPMPRTQSSAPPARRKPASAGTSSGSSAASPTPAAVARATPQPATTSSPGCDQRNTDPAVASTPAAPDIPTQARADGTNGIVLINVQIDATGRVAGTNVTQSSGNSSLDLVAVSMARDARYTPALRDCKPVAGAYTFSVKFVAW
jgi:periplasmic protein TonB